MIPSDLTPPATAEEQQLAEKLFIIAVGELQRVQGRGGFTWAEASPENRFGLLIIARHVAGNYAPIRPVPPVRRPKQGGVW